jgi:alkylation response protein AidB-like acyl-CoA dehydrogenase
MKNNLSSEQIERQKTYRAFIAKEVIPYADQFDQDESIPLELIKTMGTSGFFHTELDPISVGLLCEEIGRGCASLLSIITVHTMVSQVIQRWGTKKQKEDWTPSLNNGTTIGAFALSEPDVGSDAKSVKTSAVLNGDSYILNGKKKWISCALRADLFLVIAQCEGKPVAFVVEKDIPGFSITPIKGLLGLRAAMLGEITMIDCSIPKENMIGSVGFGFSHIVNTALNQGRYCIAWGCVGLGQACLDASLEYANRREQFGTRLKGHQLIQQMVADMITQLKAARLLCLHAAYLKELGDPTLIMETSIAKYFASTMVNKIAGDAVQIHGANGCSIEYPVQRYLRDARIMEIIEGSTQIQQIIIGRHGFINIQKRGGNKNL